MTNKNSSKMPASVAVLCLLLMSLGACQKEGPAERAGKEVDKATTAVGQQIEKAGDKIQEATGQNK